MMTILFQGTISNLSRINFIWNHQEILFYIERRATAEEENSAYYIF